VQWLNYAVYTLDNNQAYKLHSLIIYNYDVPYLSVRRVSSCCCCCCCCCYRRSDYWSVSGQWSVCVIAVRRRFNACCPPHTGLSMTWIRHRYQGNVRLLTLWSSPPHYGAALSIVVGSSVVSSVDVCNSALSLSNLGLVLGFSDILKPGYPPGIEMVIRWHVPVSIR